MAISSQNTNLNQFVPPMCVHAPVESQTFLYNSAKKVWENRTIEAADLGGIAPVDLVWEGGIFGPGDVVTISNDLTTFVSLDRSLLSGPGAATALNDLTDVSIISPIATNQVLTYDGLQWGASSVDYTNIANVPTEFAPAAHTHTASEITDLTTLYYDKIEVDSFLDDKIDVVLAALDSNFAMFDGGQLSDSGVNAASFATAAQGALADTALQTGSMIGRLNNNVGYITETDVSTYSINILSDVDTTTVAPINGQVLKWNGTQWAPADDIDTDTNLVTSVFTRTGDVVAVAGDYTATQITYSNATSGLTATNTQAAIDELDAQIDVNTANIATNTTDIATLQGAGYLTDISGESIGDLSDVDLTGVANNSILVWQAGQFVVLTNTFLAQTDTPANYVGAAGKLVAVNTAETALEFIDVIDGGTY